MNFEKWGLEMLHYNSCARLRHSQCSWIAYFSLSISSDRHAETVLEQFVSSIASHFAKPLLVRAFRFTKYMWKVQRVFGPSMYLMLAMLFLYVFSTASLSERWGIGIECCIQVPARGKLRQSKLVSSTIDHVNVRMKEAVIALLVISQK